MTHEMTFLFSDGYDDHWLCPICGRYIVFQMEPDVNKLEIVDEGDTTIAHSGSTGGLHIGGVEITQ